MVAAPVPAPLAPPGAGLRGRVVDGALRAIAEVGLAKLTMDDVARAAGCSRATLYRHFPGRTAVLSAVVGAELERLGDELDAALAGAATLPEALLAAADHGVRAFCGHAAVGHLLATEPGSILPWLTFRRAERLIATAGARLAPHLGRFTTPAAAGGPGAGVSPGGSGAGEPAGDRATALAEWLARIVLSYCLTDREATAAARRAEVRAAVCAFVLPTVEGAVP